MSLKTAFIFEKSGVTRGDKMKYVHKMISSPVGGLKLVASSKGLAAILWQNDKPDRVPLSESLEDNDHPVLVETERQLNEYFQGKRKTFTLKLDPVGTEFQQKVWKVLRDIPFGETRSYGELAKQIRKPTASRAVGAANRQNPISIVVPCHRVIGSNGKLTGFAGGLKIKATLLTLESGNTMKEWRDFPNGKQ